MKRAVLGLLAVVVLVGLIVLGFAGYQLVNARVSEGSYRNAVATGAARELAARGTPVAGRLTCRVGTRTTATITVTCRGHTTRGEEVVVTGGARDTDTAHPAEEYTITVAGRIAVRTDCLGAGCRR